MAGLTRYVRILQLFTDQQGEWTIPDIAAALSLPASTIYRTVRELVACRFLETASEGQYRLGCCFTEFDRVARKTDPLYEAGAGLLKELIIQARVPCVAILARLYNDKIMCVADAASEHLNFSPSLERGRPRPFARGATSKVILAQLSSRKLTRLLEANGADGPAYATFSRNELREELATIRKRGFSISRGEVDKHLVGIAAFVTLPARGLIGSLSLIIEATGDAALERRLTMLVVSTSSLLTHQLTAVPDHKMSSIASNVTAL